MKSPWQCNLFSLAVNKRLWKGALAFRALNFYLPPPKSWQSTSFLNNSTKTIQAHSFTFICLHVLPIFHPKEVPYIMGRSINSEVGTAGSESGLPLLIV